MAVKLAFFHRSKKFFFYQRRMICRMEKDIRCCLWTYDIRKSHPPLCNEETLSREGDIGPRDVCIQLEGASMRRA